MDQQKQDARTEHGQHSLFQLEHVLSSYTSTTVPAGTAYGMFTTHNSNRALIVAAPRTLQGRTAGSAALLMSCTA